MHYMSSVELMFYSSVIVNLNMRNEFQSSDIDLFPIILFNGY